MSKAVVNEFQPSVTEWFALIGEQKAAEEFREEDNHKVDRLEYLYQTIGLPYERPEKLEATELSNPSERFKQILKDRGDELCAIRLVPKKEGLPKIRNRGLSIRRCYEDWYLKQDIDPENYFAYICPHVPDILWSMIFAVKEDQIFGEIVAGGHAQLTQGDTTHQTFDFQFNYNNWSWTGENQEAEKVVKKALNSLLVRVPTVHPPGGQLAGGGNKQKLITKELKTVFYHNYLSGYFEAVVWPDGRIHFIDFNRVLSNYIPSPSKLTNAKNSILSGKVAFPGKVDGKVVIVNEDNIKNVDFKKGDILVCKNTDVRFLPLMKKADGIITDLGGLLSHAAIIARELQIPCLIDTKSATATLKTGDKIILDCDKNKVSVLR